MNIPSQKPASAPVVAESRGFWDRVEATASVVREYGLQIAALVGVVAFGVCLWACPEAAIIPLILAMLLILASMANQSRPEAAVPIHLTILTSGLPEQDPIGLGWTRRRPPHRGRNPFPPPAPPMPPRNPPHA